MSTRRGLLGAGLAGAALSLVGASRAAASTPGDGRPGGPDRELLVSVQSIELSARDLYRAAGAAGSEEPLFGFLAQQHAAYAEGLASLLGVPANTRDDAVFDDLESTFAVADTAAVATAGYDLESALVATHTAVLGRLESVRGARMVAATLAMEARHCAVLADLSGRGDDLDALLVNEAQPLLPEAQS
jgi:hypothetical protein